MATLGLQMEEEIYLGIDFGTTNSVLSLFNGNSQEILSLEIGGSPLVPTAIQFLEDPNDKGKLLRIFGYEAKESAVIYPENTVLNIKTLLGKEQPITITVGSRRYTFKPEEIVGEILQFLKQQGEVYLQGQYGNTGSFSGCVITVPANSTDKQKRKTKEAAIMAGFEEDKVFLRLEPAAAAIAYAYAQKVEKKIMVYDFGGGTFDACVLGLATEGNTLPTISILSTYGDNRLGGNDLDFIMMDLIYDVFLKQTEGKINLFDGQEDVLTKQQKAVAISRLNQVATQAKERLSLAKSVCITLAPFVQIPFPVNLKIDVTRDQFLNYKRQYKLSQDDQTFNQFKGLSVIDLIDKTMDCVSQCLMAANVKAEAIDDVFLVGGSSSMPLIEEKIELFFGKRPYQSKISPAYSISIGAAYYCQMIMSPDHQVPKVKEKTIHPLGLEVAGRRFLEIVHQGIEIPIEGLLVEADQLLETNFDHLTSMAIAVYEDTQPDTHQGLKYVYEKGMKRLAGTTLSGIPKAKKGEEKVQVTFKVMQDNMLTVLAKSVSTEGLETVLSVDELY